MVFIFIIFIKLNSPKINKFFIVKDIIICVAFVIWLIIYIIYAEIKYKPININIDNHYKEILDLFNKRRKQIYFLSSIIIMAFIIVYEIYFLFFSKKFLKININIDKGSQNSDNVLAQQNPQIVNRNNNNNLVGSVRVIGYNEGVNDLISGERPLIDRLRQSNVSTRHLPPIRNRASQI